MDPLLGYKPEVSLIPAASGPILAMKGGGPTEDIIHINTLVINFLKEPSNNKFFKPKPMGNVFVYSETNTDNDDIKRNLNTQIAKYTYTVPNTPTINETTNEKGDGVVRIQYDLIVSDTPTVSIDAPVVALDPATTDAVIKAATDAAVEAVKVHLASAPAGPSAPLPPAPAGPSAPLPPAPAPTTPISSSSASSSASSVSSSSSANFDTRREDDPLTRYSTPLHDSLSQQDKDIMFYERLGLSTKTLKWYNKYVRIGQEFFVSQQLLEYLLTTYLFKNYVCSHKQPSAKSASGNSNSNVNSVSINSPEKGGKLKKTLKRPKIIKKTHKRYKKTQKRHKKTNKKQIYRKK